jgi:hypothetical protein
VSEKTSENAAIDVVYVVLPFQCRIWATSSSRFLEKSGLQPEEGIAKDRLRHNLNDLRFTNFTKSNLRQPNPQETTKQSTVEVGLNGAGLSCPGSSVVADKDEHLRPAD